MKKSVKILILCGSVLAALILAAVIVWLVKPVKVSMYGESKIVRLSDATETLKQMYATSKKSTFDVLEEGKSVMQISISTALHPNFDDKLVEDINDDNIIDYYKNLLAEKEVYTWELNKSLKNLRTNLRPINDKRIPSTSAAIVLGKDGFSIQKEVYGNKIRGPILADLMKDSVSKGVLFADIADKEVRKKFNVYPMPRIVADDLEKPLTKANNVYNCDIEYTNGMKFDWKTLKDHLLVKRKTVVFDDSVIDEFVNKLNVKYTSIGSTRSLKIHTGETIEITGGTYGNVMDSGKEKAYLKAAVRKGKTKTERIPECSEKSVYGDGVNDLGDTYIEVNIAEQHLWYYKKGKLLMETDVVTGTRGSHDTPTGVYFMSEKVPGEYLIGDDYKTWVDRWMRLTNSGIGLHDATWRSRFGGTIYTYSGSHGCINLPASFAKALYDEVPICVPVMVYYHPISSTAPKSGTKVEE